MCKKKKNSKCHSEQLSEEASSTGRLFFDAAHSMSSEVIDFDAAISDTGRKESVQVALLRTHGEDGAYL